LKFGVHDFVVDVSPRGLSAIAGLPCVVQQWLHCHINWCERWLLVLDELLHLAAHMYSPSLSLQWSQRNRPPVKPVVIRIVTCWRERSYLV